MSIYEGFLNLSDEKTSGSVKFMSKTRIVKIWKHTALPSQCNVQDHPEVSEHLHGEDDLDGSFGAVHPADSAVPAFVGIEDLSLLLFLVQADEIPWTVPITDSTAGAFGFVNRGWHGSTSQAFCLGAGSKAT